MGERSLAKGNMKIIYDSVSNDYVYPLAKSDVNQIKNNVPSDIWDRILYIRFGFSANSTHSGRMFRRGSSYRIRVNFCPRKVKDGLQSPLVCMRKDYVEGVKRCGGIPDLATKTIAWDAGSAKRYALYVLLHEIGHVMYAEQRLPGYDVHRPTQKEEDWCDAYSAKIMRKLSKS